MTKLQFPLTGDDLTVAKAMAFPRKQAIYAYLFDSVEHKLFIKEWTLKLQECHSMDDFLSCLDQVKRARKRLSDLAVEYPSYLKSDLAAVRKQEALLNNDCNYRKQRGVEQCFYDRQLKRFTSSSYWKPIPFIDNTKNNYFFTNLTFEDIAALPEL